MSWRLFRGVRTPLLILTALLLGACAATSSDAPAPLETSARIDLPRYMGAWYVIANVPYFGERGNVAAQDIYSIGKDGEIDTVYRYRKNFDAPEKTIESVGEVQPGSNNAFWRIRFFGILKADYLVLEVAPDYSWALIGQPDRDLAWVFAREARMDDALYAQLLGKMAGYGYDTAKILRVPQFPDQVGQPGFQ